MKLKINGYSLTPTIVVAGLDFGHGDPLALEIGAKIGSVWINFKEFYQERLGITETLVMLVRMVKKYDIERIWADSEDPKMIEFLQKHRLPVIPNLIKSVDYGIATVYALMKNEADHPTLGRGSKFRVDQKACPNLVREFSQYGYTVVKGEVRAGKPIDKHNHALDAVRYYITNEGEMPPDVYRDMHDIPKRHPGMYVKDGRWRDDPIGWQLHKKMRNVDVPGEWWDEKENSIPDRSELIGYDDEDL